MDKCEDYICGYASRFIKNNWDKVEVDVFDLLIEDYDMEDPKTEIPEVIKDNYEIASWVVSEVFSWGMDMDYLDELKVQDDVNGFVLQFEEDTYVKFKIDEDYNWHVEFVEPKTKEVVYFE